MRNLGSAVLKNLEENGVRNWKAKPRNRGQWRQIVKLGLILLLPIYCQVAISCILKNENPKT